MKRILSQKSGILLLGGIALLIVLALSYKNYIIANQLINYQLFNLNQSFSWKEYKGEILRIDSKANLESTLLSKDTWSSWEMSFVITNPNDCGFVYAYKNKANFQYISFSRDDNALAWGIRQNGKIVNAKAVPLRYRPVLVGKISVEKEKVRLSFAGENDLEMALIDSSGRMGLILQRATRPPTTFRIVSFNGRTTRGRWISQKGSGLGKMTDGGYIFSFILFYAVAIGLSFYLAFLLRQTPALYVKNPLEKLNSQNRGIWTALFIHLGITVYLFWPFIFKGEVLVASSDNYGEIFPLFFLSKHNFLKILQGESLCLWNRLSHNGIPFFSNHWSMIYYPLNWPIFLLSDKYALLALTARNFLEVLLTGLCAYGFFALEFRSRSWALLCSVAYLLGSFLIFALTVFPTISLFFAMTFYLYLLWSIPYRKMVSNYFLITLAIVLILTAANMAFIFYASLAMAVLTVYRVSQLKKQKKDQIKTLKVLGIGVIVGSMIAAIRIIPCCLGILNSSRIVHHYYTLHDRFFLITRMFVPEISGWNAFNVLTSPKTLKFIYEQANLPSNPQNAFFVYIGILGALLLSASIFLKAKGKHLFWKVYAFIVLGIGLLFQPFWGIFSIFLFPMIHYSYHMIIVPIGLCALAGYTGLYWEKKNFNVQVNSEKIILFLLMMQAFVLVIVTYVFPALTNATRFSFLGMGLWYVFYRRIKQKNPLRLKGYLYFSALAVEVIIWTLLFLCAATAAMFPIFSKDVATLYVILPVLVALGVLLRSLQICHIPEGTTGRRLVKYLSPVLIGGVACAVILSGAFQQFLKIESAVRDYFVFLLLGETRFLVVTLIVLSSILLYQKRVITKGLLKGLFLVVCILDLAAFNTHYSNIVAPPPQRVVFYANKFPYRDMIPSVKEKLDLVNYRCDSLNKSRVNSNKNLIFDVPSYTGILGYMPRRFWRLVTNFGYPERTILIYPANASNSERFLDLSAVRYKFIHEQHYLERQTALARLNLMQNYRVIEDDEALLQELKNNAFNPQFEVLLSRIPEVAIGGNRRKFSQMIPITKANSDYIFAKAQTDRPALILFVESFHPGWKAFIDGKETAVYRANYNFMACVLPAGSHTIEWKFLPKSFFIALKISAAGVVLLVLTLIYFFIKDLKKRKNNLRI